MLALYEYFSNDMLTVNPETSSYINSNGSARIQTNPLYRKDIKLNHRSSIVSKVTSTSPLSTSAGGDAESSVTITPTKPTKPQPKPVQIRHGPSYYLSTAISYYPLFNSLITLKQYKLLVDILYNDMVGKRGNLKKYITV